MMASAGDMFPAIIRILSPTKSLQAIDKTSTLGYDMFVRFTEQSSKPGVTMKPRSPKLFLFLTVLIDLLASVLSYR